MNQQPQPLGKIIDYQVATGTDAINDLLKKDYQPYSAPHFTENILVVQVMVKYDDAIEKLTAKLLKETEDMISNKAADW